MMINKLTIPQIYSNPTLGSCACCLKDIAVEVEIDGIKEIHSALKIDIIAPEDGMVENASYTLCVTCINKHLRKVRKFTAIIW